MTALEKQGAMQRCFDLALHGSGRVAPNPMVGAVIMHDSKIIGEGYHEYFGGPHAEVNAIRAVADKTLLSHSALYVNLEPCCYHGKTPPCTDLIIEAGIEKVVIAHRDPNPLVHGKGIRQLRKAGVHVQTGILENEGKWLNRRFISYQKKKRPYIMLKWAQSADGFLAKDSMQRHWITGEQSQRLVHRWRSEEAAVMVGTNTVRADNPHLTNRLWMNGKQPVRIILDRKLQLPESMNVFDSSAPTLVFTEMKRNDKKNISYVRLAFGDGFLPAVMAKLFEAGILSVIVEGGVLLLNNFIRQQLWDEARIFTGKAFFGKGVPAPFISGNIISEETIGDDFLRIVINPSITL